MTPQLPLRLDEQGCAAASNRDAMAKRGRLRQRRGHSEKPERDAGSAGRQVESGRMARPRIGGEDRGDFAVTFAEEANAGF
jgi:hypothetical protein